VRAARTGRFAVNELVLINDGLDRLASKKSKAKKQRKLQKQLKRERRVSVTVNLNQPKRSSNLVQMLSRLFRVAASAIILFHI
jgi:arginine utilization protein RocB